MYKLLDKIAIIGKGNPDSGQKWLYLKSQKGSHQKLTDGNRNVIVPYPRKEIPIGTLHSISRQSGIDFSEFINL